jgi:hypothetical protein
MYFLHSERKKNKKSSNLYFCHTRVPFAISSSLNSIRAVPKLINARSTGSFS